ncbi:MAG: hypothetical protein A2341_22365 [Deltaproteobacteria bacterium RIFOXYB12_FULL_58_9]|nr:MAG: hypothetical protein A2341_22365 [Deltaproteobacteria bacterium RIFOXYB12_FULL_58_9]
MRVPAKELAAPAARLRRVEMLAGLDLPGLRRLSLSMRRLRAGLADQYPLTSLAKDTTFGSNEHVNVQPACRLREQAQCAHAAPAVGFTKTRPGHRTHTNSNAGIADHDHATTGALTATSRATRLVLLVWRCTRSPQLS